MILRAFKNKFTRLVWDEDGVALIVTLAVFFFIYLVCMGVYAVGMNVRERIHLQNACDAAAYSAAVVQADTLSRIATINRAMSWTYVQLTRRQMDYIVWKWLDHTKMHYVEDRNVCKSVSSAGEPDHFHRAWWIGADSHDPTTYDSLVDEMYKYGQVDLNGTHYPYIDGNHESTTVESALSGFESHIGGKSFYLEQGEKQGKIEWLKAQIEEDRSAIRNMNSNIETLASDVGGRIDNVVKGILAANLTDWTLSNCCFTVQRADSAFSYLRYLDHTEEDRFLLYSDSSLSAQSWMPLNTNPTVGIQRHYVQQEKSLVSKWFWWAKFWTCTEIAGKWTCVYAYVGECDHGSVQHPCSGHYDGNCDKCSAGSLHQAELKASHIWDGLFDGEIAKPLAVDKSYFGTNGTISVGLALRNENPFARILSEVGDLGGIFAAFNPFVEWTFAFASAKAGYRTPEESVTFGRDYRIDWKEGGTADNDESKWNLYTSDWDAVLIPVRMAGSKAEDGAWDVGNTGFLEDWVDGFWQPLGDGGNSVATQIPAGGTGKSMSDHFSQVEKESANWWYEWAGEQTHVTNNENDGENQKIDVKWQIGNPGGNIDWGVLTERMFH